MTTKKKIAFLSNITSDLVIGKLSNRYDFYVPDGFDTWVHEIIDTTSELYSYTMDAIVVLLDGTEARAWKSTSEGEERINFWKQAISLLVENFPVIPIVLPTIDIRENRIKSLSERQMKYEIENDWYQFVQGLVEKKTNVYLLDLADTISEVGRKRFYSNKMWYMSSMPYSREGLMLVSAEVSRALDSCFSPRKKVIVLDLDNTLWGGVIGEDGIEGVSLSNHKEGQRFYDFQRQLLEMKKRGILLALNSKNNYEEAEAMIQSHPSMLLRSGDFVCKKVNWDNKACNLKEIEQELNISESGFIFIDDNPMERETIRGECPEVYVPDFPSDTTELLEFAENIWFDYCRPSRVLEDDLYKTQMYHNEVLRKTEMKESLNLDEYLTKLELVADIHRMKDNEIDRVVQLINKTNQFNLTTKRYSQADINEMNSNSNYIIYVVHCSDKYGDYGLISVLILCKDEGCIHIDSFLMSCRVMGRKLEDVIINELAGKYHCKIYSEFISTNKNKPVNELYDRLGFTKINEEEGRKEYLFDATGYCKKKNYQYRDIKFEDEN